MSAPQMPDPQIIDNLAGEMRQLRILLNVAGDAVADAMVHADKLEEADALLDIARTLSKQISMRTQDFSNAYSGAWDAKAAKP